MINLNINKEEAKILLRAIRGDGINTTEKRFVITPIVDFLEKETSGLCRQCFDNNCLYQCSTISCNNCYEEIIV